MGNLEIILCLTFILSIHNGAFGQNLQFTRSMNGYDISESINTGTLVFQLQASDETGSSSNFQFEISSPNDVFEIPNPATGEVFLAQRLDYEMTKTVEVTMRVSAGDESVEQIGTVNVVDADDEAPHFTEETYDITVPENTERNSVIFQNLTVQDVDTVNTVVNVECAESTETQFQGACEMFGLAPRESNGRLWRGDVTLRQPLDAEVQNIFNIPIRAYDGVLRESHLTLKTMIIRVADIQDTPPMWRPSQNPTVTILEGTTKGVSILNISSEDGDILNKRDVSLTLISNPNALFRLDTLSSGEVSITTDQVISTTGSVELKVQACEILPNGVESNSLLDCSLATVVVVIEDINNHAPTFARSLYDMNIPENIAVNTPLPNLNLVVVDHDLGDNAVFDVMLDNYADIFTIMPAQGTRDLTASIYVTDSSMLDYESAMKTYEIIVIARESSTTDMLSSTTVVRVHIDDVNDNPPTFDRTSYTATVSETAPVASPVTQITADDRDSGRNGVSSLWYKLIGNGADKFICNLITGQVTVAPCPTPGYGNCLDAETTGAYELTFVVADRFGEGFQVSVPLTITVTDVNDNPPELDVDNIVSFITEGETIPDPPVRVVADDPDGNDQVTYSIVGGNVNVNGILLWTIGSTTGVIVGTSPIDYETIPGNTGRYVLTVKATDGVHDVTAQVIINVIDTNDHPPVFDVSNYEQEIPESTPPFTFIDRVRATDRDPTDMPSGQISYRIVQGGQDQFLLDSNSGDITVADGVTFDVDLKQDRYEMTVVASDQGSPQKSASATVVILIRDVNNKNPFFQPSIIRAGIKEDAIIGTPVMTVNATDLDSNSSLIYFIEEPIIAFNPENQPIALTPDTRAMFSIERLTGVIRVNRTLQYDTVARWQAGLKARDNAGSPDQTGTGTVIINIIEINKRPPVFGEPWSPDNAFIPITVNEGQPRGTYVTTLVATDPTDAIKEFKITNDPGDHFTINSTTGSVTIKTPLDYEAERTTRFTVVAVDNGAPSLSATATVMVNIGNINDETPIFTEVDYNERLPENSPDGTLLAVITATDKDLGDFGIVRYELDPKTRFTIDSVTGRITVLPGAILDREEEPSITLTVTAYDSPNNPDVRRYAQMPIYITLTDTNDNSPSFPQQEYIAVILENVPSMTSVVQVSANDNDDEGPNSRITYYEVSGDPLNLFVIDPFTGLITTNGSLIGYAGTYNMTIGATDSGSPTPLLGDTLARIRVLEANNGPPRWVIPRTTNQTVNVIEETYIGEEIIDVHAEDRDPGKNGEVEYGFSYKNRFVTETPEFAINPNTGQITAKVIFDREERDSYILLLVARDKGDPPFMSEIYLFIRITDVNDNLPEFPKYYNCCAIPYSISIYEDIAVNTLLGNVTALDADIGINALVFYSIMSGNTDVAFRLDHSTGSIYVNNDLDHERQKLYTLTIQAVDLNGADGTFEIGSQCRCSDPSRVILNVFILDRNDFPPVFPDSRYHTCIPIDSELGKRVTVMEAIDNDSGTSRDVRYNITRSNNYHSVDGDDKTLAPADSFIIGRDNGSVFSNTLMNKYEDHYFVLRVRAEDIDQKYSETQLYVFVTESDQEITMVFDRPPGEVREDLDQIIAMISRLTNNGMVCVGDLSYHVTVSNLIDPDRSDLTFYVINNATLVVIPTTGVIPKLEGKMGVFGVVAIFASYTYWDGFVIDPVLAAVIVILILLLIALLLLCCLCWCLGAIFGKKRYTYEGKPLYLGTINPLWGHKFSEDQELTMAVNEFETVEPTLGSANAAFQGDTVDAAGKTETHTHIHTESYNYTSSNMAGMSNGQISPGGVNIRIEAPLEGSDEAGGLYLSRAQYTNYDDVAHRNVLRSTATMTDDERSDLGSTRAMSQRVGFGATLTRPDHQQERVISESYSDFGENRATRSVSGVGSQTRYRLYTGGSGSQTLPPQFSGNQYNTLLSTEEIGHDISTPDVFAPPNSTYQGEIHVNGGRGIHPPQHGQHVQTTYIQSQDLRY